MNNQLIELLNSFKFHCEAYINQFKQLCEICEIPDKSELIGKEQLYEYGTEIKKINGWYKAKTPLSNPYLHPEFTGNRAAFDQYYYNKVNEVSRLLIDTLNSYLIENSNHDAIKKLLRKDLDTYENFKDFECLKELENFKTAIKLIIEQCDYNEKNNGATPEFNRILELRKETEFYYKTDCSNVHGNNLEVMYNIQHLQDYKNFQKKIDSCNDAETLKAHLTETFRKWKGKKSQWIEYTILSIAPPNSNNNVLKTSAWFEWFESHKEQENEPISNDVAIEVKPILEPQFDFEKELNYLKNAENKFDKSLPMPQVIEHFKVFTTIDSNNGSKFLTEKQFISFIKKGFLNDNSQPKQSFNYANGEKGFIIKRFYEFFFDVAVSKHNVHNRKKPFIELVEICFEGMEYKKVESLFKSNKTLRTW